MADNKQSNTKQPSATKDPASSLCPKQAPEDPGTIIAAPHIHPTRRATPSPQAPAQAEASCWWCRRLKPHDPVPTGCRRVYIPVYGYLDADDHHRRRVDRFFEWPMIILGLLVLPILAYEFIPPDKYPSAIQGVINHPNMAMAVDVAMLFIWLAFLVEFIVKISIATSRLAYATKNWLDILIILLPMLRVLRGARAIRGIRALRGLRALEAARISHVTRVFTLRGVVIKLVRAAVAVVLGLSFVSRLRARSAPPSDATSPPPDYSTWSRADLLSEIRRLRQRIARLETGPADTPSEQPPGTRS